MMENLKYSHNSPLGRGWGWVVVPAEWTCVGTLTLLERGI